MMSTFDHTGLMQDINTSLAPFRKAQSEAMQGFGQLSRAAMAEGAIRGRFVFVAKSDGWKASTGVGVVW